MSIPKFPTMLRKMWSGEEVQAWMDEHIKTPEPVGETYYLKGTTGFTMAVFKASDVPVETKLYAAPVTPAPQVPEPVYKAVERILDEHSAWVARPHLEVTQRIALAATIAAHALMDRTKYRLLDSTDVIRKDDQVINDDCVTWSDLVGWGIGMSYSSNIFKPVRRRITSEGHDR